jgi:hypothetical protein
VPFPPPLGLPKFISLDGKTYRWRNILRLTVGAFWHLPTSLTGQSFGSLCRAANYKSDSTVSVKQNARSMNPLGVHGGNSFTMLRATSVLFCWQPPQASGRD